MLESLGVPIPGETMLITAALYAGATHNLEIVLVWAVRGTRRDHRRQHRLRPRPLRRLRAAPPARQQDPRRRREAEGRKARLRPPRRQGRLLRALRLHPAHVRRVPRGRESDGYPRFLASNAAGGIVWSAIYAFGFYFAGSTLRRLRSSFDIAIGAAAAIIVIAFVLWVRHNEKRLEAQAEQAYPGPLEDHVRGNRPGSRT